MTELAIPSDGPVVTYLDPTGGRLVAWAQAASAANQLAKALAKTSFVPQAFQGKEYDATAAILMGDELGLSPLAALRSIYVVHGTPAMYARTMVALAQSHGHEVWTEKSSDTEVTVCGRRRGSDNIERSTWTISRAQKAGYTNNKQYGSNPQAMLYAKAAGEVARKVAADVLAGVPYSVEDIELDQPEPTVTVKRAEPTKAKRAAPVPPPAPEPDLDPPDTSEPEKITDPQMRKMQAQYNELGMRDRAERLAHASAFVGRELDSSSQLSKAEATRLIDNLNGLLSDGPTGELFGGAA